MANVKNNSASRDTRRRLLAAAGQVFAERGYHAATIKDITDRAEASLASVNYHFRDKAELYTTVLKSIADQAIEIIPVASELNGDARSRFRQFVRAFCLKSMGRSRPTWERILLAREMIEPTSAVNRLIKNVFGPMNETLSGIIGELLGVPPSEESVGLAAASVFGQCLHHLRYQHVIGRMHPQLGDRPDAEKLAAHIADFSLAGLRALRADAAGR